MMMTDLLYRQFRAGRKVFCAALCLAFLCFPAFSHAESDPAYTVEGVAVDVKAQNAVKAREKALSQAQVKAYGILAERFFSPEEMKNFKQPDAESVSYLVQDFEVTNEQLSNTRYKGTYTIRFRPNALKTQMAKQGKYLPAAPRKPVLVIPMYQDAGAMPKLWEEDNPWLNAWRAMPSDKSLIQPTILPLGDAQDVAQISGEEGLQYDPSSLASMATRYGAGEAAILVASPDGAKMGISLYSNSVGGAQFVQKIMLDQVVGETNEALLIRAAQKVKTVLRENWKMNAAYQPPAQAAAQAAAPVPVPYTRPALGPSKTYAARVRFGSVQDWVRIKNTLDKTYGMNGVMLKSIKPREALVNLMYAADLNSLQISLQNAGIVLRGNTSGGLELHMTGAQFTSTAGQ